LTATAIEIRHARDYPLARWYLRPLAGWLAARLAKAAIRPWHVTLLGLLVAAIAGLLLVVRPDLAPACGLLALLYWFCDRTDGQLARLQGTASRLGAWLDGNIDELVDLGLHLALAFAAAAQGSRFAWPFLIAFFFGKYLLMYGLQSPPAAGEPSVPAKQSLVRTLYHLPANADVRVHLLVLALATGWFTAELALIAVYYNLRWMARYALMASHAMRQPR
jgi:phosphatidylglycerophosphate synthase